MTLHSLLKLLLASIILEPHSKISHSFLLLRSYCLLSSPPSFSRWADWCYASILSPEIYLFQQTRPASSAGRNCWLQKGKVGFEVRRKKLLLKKYASTQFFVKVICWSPPWYHPGARYVVLFYYLLICLCFNNQGFSNSGRCVLIFRCTWYEISSLTSSSQCFSHRFCWCWILSLLSIFSHQMLHRSGCRDRVTQPSAYQTTQIRNYWSVYNRIAIEHPLVFYDPWTIDS